MKLVLKSYVQNSTRDKQFLVFNPFTLKYFIVRGGRSVRQINEKFIFWSL